MKLLRSQDEGDGIIRFYLLDKDEGCDAYYIVEDGNLSKQLLLKPSSEIPLFECHISDVEAIHDALIFYVTNLAKEKSQVQCCNNCVSKRNISNTFERFCMNEKKLITLKMEQDCKKFDPIIMSTEEEYIDGLFEEIGKEKLFKLFIRKFKNDLIQLGN